MCHKASGEGWFGHSIDSCLAGYDVMIDTICHDQCFATLLECTIVCVLFSAVPRSRPHQCERFVSLSDCHLKTK